MYPVLMYSCVVAPIWGKCFSIVSGGAYLCIYGGAYKQSDDEGVFISIL
jgi:hypothetical protein